MREKIDIGGYPHWIDRKKQIIYPTEHAKNGVVFDSDNQTFVRLAKLTKEEEKQVLDFLRK